MAKIETLKCRFCEVCNGEKCSGELPGMGGVNNSENVKRNFASWQEIGLKFEKGELFIGGRAIQPSKNNAQRASVRLAPMTGAVENLGYPEERPWYFDIVETCTRLGVPISVGDGTPDEKLQFGLEALRINNNKGFVCIKPYSNPEIEKRIEWAHGVAEMIGIDIDAYEILTMRNLVNLEKKTASQLRELKNKLAVPFVIKGVFTPDTIELVKELKPDIAIVSNHGGRVPVGTGSTLDFFIQHGAELARYAGELWLDGGIRFPRDLVLAHALGAQTVLIGRPFATAMMKGGVEEIKAMLNRLGV